jgi:hypothetical protein
MRHGTKRDTTSPAATRERGSVSVDQAEGGGVCVPVAGETRSPLDILVREGARKMLQVALEKEVQMFLEEHSMRLDEQGRRRVVREVLSKVVYR